LFIVVDGVVTGFGNDTPTSEILLSILQIDASIESSGHFDYESLGVEADMVNRAQVYSGYYGGNGGSQDRRSFYCCNQDWKVGRDQHCKGWEPGQTTIHSLSCYECSLAPFTTTL